MIKKIKIFLASSIEDLKYDRLEIGDFFRQLNEIYLDSNIHFSLIKCEDYDNALAAEGKQTQYDGEIRDSDVVFFLFFRKVGKYTKHEFEVALEQFKKTNDKPRIVTYFKYVETIDEACDEVKAFMAMLDGELRHYYNTYGNIDTLKLGMLMQIKLMRLDSSAIKLEDGEVKLNGKAIVKAENIPYLKCNDALSELTAKKKELKERLSLCRAAYLSDPCEENESAFFSASAELKEISNQLTKLEKDVLELMTTVAEITTDGRVLTHRQKNALNFFYQGDYDSAQAILDDKERECELERAENRAEVSLREIEGHIEEERLWIEMEQSRKGALERTDLIREKFQKISGLVEKYGVGVDTLNDYAYFLFSQSDYGEVIEIANRALWYYSKPGESGKNEEKAYLYELMASSYEKRELYGDAEEAYRRAIDAFVRLNGESGFNYDDILADLYRNLSRLYKELSEYDKADAMSKNAEITYKKACELYERICDSDSDEEPLLRLASSYGDLGSFYGSARRFGEAEGAYRKSLKAYITAREKCLEARPHMITQIDESIEAIKNVLDVLEKIKTELGSL